MAGATGWTVAVKGTLRPPGVITMNVAYGPTSNGSWASMWSGITASRGTAEPLTVAQVSAGGLGRGVAPAEPEPPEMFEPKIRTSDPGASAPPSARLPTEAITGPVFD